LSVGAGPQHAAVLELLADSDVVLAAGTEFAPSDWWLGPPDVADRLIRIDVDATALTTNVAPVCGIVADAAQALDAILSRLDAPPRTDTARAATWRQRIRTESRAEGEPWSDLLHTIEKALPSDAIVAADNAMVSYYGALSNLPLHRPRSFLFPTGAGTLGYGLPAGIGAKLGLPDAPVVVLQGDGGAMFTIAELATAAELGIALPIVIVDNGGYGEIRNEMADRGDPIHSVALGHPDFAALAESLGCHGVRVANVEDLAAELTDALAVSRPTLLHVREESRAAQAMARTR
ncbi:MAG: thiamine pyrophosphate-binding protein, partial [Nocardioidaceae bacterium]